MTISTSASARPAFEDLQVGQELPPLARGPLSSAHLMRWSAATENWHRIHYDAPYSADQEQLPGLLISGSWKQQLLTDLVSSWLRPDGWLAGITFEFRRMNIAGEALTARGTISDLRVQDDYGLVTCDIGIINDDGQESTPGRALGIVPLAGGPAVPYPCTLDWDWGRNG
ncbi:MaoC family dehydratase [Rhodococcus sp. NPDC057529]|uniref:MaoC family dehydratase n=1 Tax=Rhodococcus sp. NPDC057529 TaxID=3346158 RepID=UPI00366BF8D0